MILTRKTFNKIFLAGGTSIYVANIYLYCKT